jgi:hypothetical protein
MHLIPSPARCALIPSLFCVVLIAPLFAALAVPAAAAAPTGEWQTLFDGRDVSAWRILGKPETAPLTWNIEGGALAGNKGTGNLATRESYADFELELEWKISPGGNSGVMFRVDPGSSRPPQSGHEIQVLDDARHKDGKGPLTSAGALYALYAPKVAAAKPVGEWNALRLRVQGKRIQSWLNGQLVIEAEIDSPDWKERVAQSKFAKFPQFGRAPSGLIVLQDHGDPVWYRAIRIRRL